MPATQKTMTPKDKKKKGLGENTIVKSLLILVILMLIALPALLVKYDINGIGQKTRPLLQDIPYVQQILPPKPDPEDPTYMSRQELFDRYIIYQYEYEQAYNEVQQLKAELRKLEEIQKEYHKFAQSVEQLNQDRIALEEEREQLEQNKQSFYNDIKNEVPKDFRVYFETIDRETAERLYEEILKEENADKQMQAYASYYQRMEADTAARIFEEMGSAQIDLIVATIKVMNRNEASDIIAAMDMRFAARITSRLSEEYLE